MHSYVSNSFVIWKIILRAFSYTHTWGYLFNDNDIVAIQLLHFFLEKTNITHMYAHVSKKNSCISAEIPGSLLKPQYTHRISTEKEETRQKGGNKAFRS